MKMFAASSSPRPFETNIDAVVTHSLYCQMMLLLEPFFNDGGGGGGPNSFFITTNLVQ